MCIVKIALVFLSFAAVSLPTLFSTDIPALETKARQGDADAQFELARIYLKGSDGVSKNLMRSFELMTSSANQGHAEAIGGIGFFYASGTAVPKDNAKAVEWFRKGAEAGGAKAQLNLGRMLAEGKGVEKNEAEGRKWIKAAADQGQTDAAFAMGAICYFGDYGQAVDYKAAYPYLLKAAEAGHPEAQNMVGILWDTALLEKKDVKEAEKWFRKAAHQGHIKAQSNLGRLLGPWGGTDAVRRIEGIKWLLIADSQHEVTAGKVLAEVLPNMDEAEVAKAKMQAGDFLEKHRQNLPPVNK